MFLWVLSYSGKLMECKEGLVGASRSLASCSSKLEAQLTTGTWDLASEVAYIYTRTHTHIHTLEYYLVIKHNEIMPFAATWRNLEITILSEISQRQISYKITYVWNTLISCNKLNGKESEKVYISISISISESSCCIPEANTILEINYTSIKKTKRNVKKNHPAIHLKVRQCFLSVKYQ